MSNMGEEAKVCPKEYQVTQQLDSQSISIGNLSSIVNKLCDRLEGVCLSSNLEDNSVKDKQELVKLAEALEANTSNIKYNIRVLEDLHDRIEL